MLAQKRPNILFAIADDASHFGIFGHDFVKTPNIDEIANQGIKFENAFTCNPKCAPSRATILTGRYTWQLEEGCNHFGLFPGQFPLYTDLLEENGYHVGYTGKGWAPGDYEKNGRKRNPAGNMYNNRKLTPPKDSKISSCDYFLNFADFLEDNFDDKPFCFWYGGLEPHRAYNFGEGLRGGKTLDEIKNIPSYFPDCDEVRADLIDYAYEIEWFDTQLGKMVDLLKQKNIFDNTVIIVTSDNGCPFPRVKGQMYEQDFHLPMVACYPNAKATPKKVTDIINFIDLAPTFLDLAEVTPPDCMTGKSFADIFKASGNGLIDKNRNITYFGREKHDLGRENDLGYPVRCVRTDRYLYIHNFAPDRYPAGNPETGFTNCDSSPTKEKILELFNEGEDFYYNLAFGKRPNEELYDIVLDNECMVNLADNPEFTSICAELKKKLFDLLAKTNDPRLTDPDYFERFEYVGGGNHSWKDYVNGTWEKQNF